MTRRTAQLLPWLVNDKLDADERAQALALLDADAEARELLRYAELLREAVGEDEALSSRLLVEYAERPEELDDEVRRRVARRLEDDPRADEAVAILRDLASAESRRAEEALRVDEAESAATDAEIEPTRARFLERLREVVQRPVPAFVPAGLVAALLLLLWIGPPRGGRDAGTSTAVVPLVRLESRDRFRSGAPGGETAEISAPTIGTAAGERAWVLELVTGLDLDELPDPERGELAVDFALTGPRGPVMEKRLDVGDFEGGSILRLLVPAGAVVEPGLYRIELRYRAPGSPLDGLVGFETGFVLERESRE